MFERAQWVQGEIDRMLPDVRPLKFYESLKEYLELSRNRVRPSMAVYEPIRHVIEAGGKRIRPTLCLLACEAVGGDPKAALPTAAAIELIHTFTLIHDDIMDEDLVRRGRPTVAAIWGNPIGITAGDGLFALAFGAIARNAHVAGVGESTALRLVEKASQTCVALCQGQTMDLLLEQDDEPTVERYMEMIGLKTGVLLEFALESGAILGHGSNDQIDALKRFGAPLGMAFQIRDDVLNLTGSVESMGKPPTSDIVRGKRTLMIAHALENLAKPASRRLRTILDSSEHRTGKDVVAEAIGLLKEAGSIEFAQTTADALIREARAALEHIPHSQAGDALRSLHQVADYVIHRDT